MWDSWIIWKFYFNFLRDLHPVFYSDGANYNLNQWYGRIPFPVYPHQHLLFAVFLMIVILTGVRRYLIVVLDCVSLMISDVEHLFICLLAICVSSLEKCLFRFFTHFLIMLFVFSDVELYEFFVYFWILTTYRIYHLEISSLILWAAFAALKLFKVVLFAYFCF